MNYVPFIGRKHTWWPTSTTFEVSRLAHPDMMIEIDMIAVVD